ncbi:RYamide neuropeptides-like [Galleria mellonella]|uniref:RYamide n=1 Tax=Galleria mellonella TaxID=7137 RepID=A0A6J1WN13_GALME|nr:RYamide neuropeptides-like [Galleria mellonella]WLY76866.1 RYamide [Galleria mellonella]
MWRWVCALMLLLAALIHADNEKRAEMSPMPFVLGSRYGRSPPRMLTPRNDRFFMGSRYGKRSEGASGSPVSLAPASPALLCEFTGLYPLYRCTPPTSTIRQLFDNRRNEEGGEEE